MSLAKMGLLDGMEPKDTKVKPVFVVLPALLALKANTETMDTWVPLDLPDPKDHAANLALLVKMEQMVLMAPLDPSVL